MNYSYILINIHLQAVCSVCRTVKLHVTITVKLCGLENSDISEVSVNVQLTWRKGSYSMSGLTIYLMASVKLLTFSFAFLHKLIKILRILVYFIVYLWLANYF